MKNKLLWRHTSIVSYFIILNQIKKSDEIIPEALQLPEYQNRIKKSLFRSEDTALQN